MYFCEVVRQNRNIVVFLRKILLFVIFYSVLESVCIKWNTLGQLTNGKWVKAQEDARKLM